MELLGTDHIVGRLYYFPLYTHGENTTVPEKMVVHSLLHISTENIPDMHIFRHQKYYGGEIRGFSLTWAREIM